MASAVFLDLKASYELSFWSELNRLKLEEWMLKEEPRPLTADLSQWARADGNYVLALNHSSFHPSEASPTTVDGTLLLYNTMENFRNADHRQIIATEVEGLWKLIRSGSWTENPRALLRFVLQMYADLKNFKYFVRTCVPTLAAPFNIENYEASAAEQSALDGIDYAKASALPFLYSVGDDGEHGCHPFTSLETLSCDKTFLIMNAIGHSEGKHVLSWQLRNILTAIVFHPSRWSYIRVALVNKDGSVCNVMKASWGDELRDEAKYSKFGWEKESRKHDLKKMFSRNDLMRQAVDLNLKLTRWRMVPSLDIERFNRKVLVVGAGTLGCNLSRLVMAWGIRHVTFLDCGFVSSSNPVRQNLFIAEDIGKPKVEAAAAALLRVFPDMSATGVSMKIPMPGHPAGSEREKVLENARQLRELIAQHDIIFLATDSRESRWLPSVISSAMEKLVITVALGFDTFVVMRHGVGSAPATDGNTIREISAKVDIPGTQLACYFCADVIAPSNSTVNRALDQQCTISRPGLSSIACGWAVELMAAVLQHRDGPFAAARLIGVDEGASILGATPHQIRGFIAQGNFLTATTARNEICPGCGGGVQELIKDNSKWEEFLLSVLDDPQKLEDACGITKLKASTNDDSMVPWSDDEFSD